MLNLWEMESASALVLADVVRDLAVRPIECEDDAEEIGRALQEVAAEISAAGATLIRLKGNPAMRCGNVLPFGRPRVSGEASHATSQSALD